MDQMFIKSAFTTGIVGKLITKWLKRKLKANVEVILNNAKVSVNDMNVCIHVDGDIMIDKSELVKLLKVYGLEED